MMSTEKPLTVILVEKSMVDRRMGLFEDLPCGRRMAKILASALGGRYMKTDLNSGKHFR